MLREIESGSVCASDALDPSVGREQLGVPAVAGVVSHLVVHVLPESKLLRVHAHLDHVLLDAGHEIGQRLVGNGARLDGLSDGRVLGRFTVHLIAGGIQQHLYKYKLKNNVLVTLKM